MVESRGYLLHMTHYDPRWVAEKENEKPFDLKLAIELVKELADNGFNLLMIDPKDAVKFRSHPELKRHYTQPMGNLRKLAAAAKKAGLEVALKINFSQSGTHQHNHWFAPHHKRFDNKEYFERAFTILDELIDAAKPERFIHVGMDEDHDRSIKQFVDAVITLNKLVTERGFRTMIWNDTACFWAQAMVHVEKSLATEKKGPKDVTHIIYDYFTPVQLKAFKRVQRRGLKLWGAPGQKIKPMMQLLDKLNAEGVLITHWIPCVQENREQLINKIKNFGDYY
ncbi:MAG: hypothetical protein GX811_09205, partial [Lentisphaerae bacterium]|nr:hypothetical protein [Lentisphaerota bacterium]